MKNHFIQISVVLILIISCKSKSSNQSDYQTDSLNIKSESVESMTDNLLLDNPIIYKYIVDTTRTIDMECVRGAAEPVLKKLVYPNSEFKLLKDSITGIEVTKTNGNGILVIKNWGCESYALSFNFILQDNSSNLKDYNHWYKKAIELMSGVYDGIDAPIDVKTGIDSLRSYVNNTDPSELAIDSEIYYGNEDMPTYIVLDDIRKVDNEIILTVSTVIGPL